MAHGHVFLKDGQGGTKKIDYVESIKDTHDGFYRIKEEGDHGYTYSVPKEKVAYIEYLEVEG